MKIGICYTFVSAENKMLLDSAKERGVELERVIDGEAVLELSGNGHGPGAGEIDALVQRSVSYSRGLYLSYYYELAGTKVVNSYNAARICGDKMLCSLELAKAGIPTPKTYVSFVPESARSAASKLGFPLVMKPVVGSWARLVHRINDADALDAELESREEMGNHLQKIYYLQEHVNKPGRDIRALVVGEEVIAAVYRNSTQKSGWITNTSRGGLASKCEVTPELSELCLKAAGIVGEGIYGVDLMESEHGLLVHEINHAVEFRNSFQAMGVDVAGKMIDYLIKTAKN